MSKLLLIYKSSPDIPNTVFGRTPLHYAVDYGHSKIVKLFMKYSASTEIEDTSKKTPADLTSNSDMISILQAKLVSDSFSENSFNSISSIGDINPSFSQYNSEKFSFNSVFNSDKAFEFTEEKTNEKCAENTERTFDIASIPFHGRSVSSLFEPDAEKSEIDVGVSNFSERVKQVSFGGKDKKHVLYA